MFYTDGQRDFFVSDGISGRRWWGTFYRTERGSLKRVKSKALPMRRKRAQAKRDLAEWATKNGYPGFRPSP